MKFFGFIAIFVFTSMLGFCQSAKIEKQDDETIVIASNENKKYNLTAIFYGIRHRPDGNNGQEYKIIKKIVFRNKENIEVAFDPTGTIPAGEFYFTEIWSPDEEHLVLPTGTTEGFAIIEAKNAFNEIRGNKFFDTIKVKSENSGWFWHKFEKWEDNSKISFRAGLSGDMWAFKYDFSKKELNCFTAECENLDIGINNDGKIKPIKKGDIEPLKVH